MSTSYRNESFDLLSKTMDWFLYDRDFHHEWVKGRIWIFSFAFVFVYDLLLLHVTSKSIDVGGVYEKFGFFSKSCFGAS